MMSVSILEDFDTIMSTDYCRPLQIVSMNDGLSDYYSFESCYSGLPQNNVKWTLVSQVFGECWHGALVKDLLDGLQTPYEFIRGTIPESHFYGKTKKEQKQDYFNYLKTHVMPYGKYKEMLLYDLKQAYPSYAEWAEDNGIIKSARDFYDE